MSFADTDEIEEMNACIFSIPPVWDDEPPADDVKRDFIYVALSTQTRNIT